MLKLCRFTKVKVFFLVLVSVFNFDLFEFSAAILEKGLLCTGAMLGTKNRIGHVGAKKYPSFEETVFFKENMSAFGTSDGAIALIPSCVKTEQMPKTHKQVTK